MLKKSIHLAVRASGLMPMFRQWFAGPGAILMFHEIHKTADDELRTGTTAAFLDRLLTWLTQNGWDIVSLDDCERMLHSGDRSSRRFVVLTFDDGYRDNVTNALPVLQRHNAPFTIYIPTGAPQRTLYCWWLGLRQLFFERDVVQVDAMEKRFDCATADAKVAALDEVCKWVHQDYRRKPTLEPTFDKADISLSSLNDRYFLDEEEIRTLSQNPLATIGGHTASHAAVSTLNPENASEEMTSNRIYLQNLLQSDIAHFAFPYGNAKAHGGRDSKLAMQAGFSTAVTTEDAPLPSGAQDIFALPRIGIRNDDTFATFDIRISGLRKAANLVRFYKQA